VPSNGNYGYRTYTIHWGGELSGQNIPELIWAETLSNNDLVKLNPDTSVNLLVTTVRDGSTSPKVNNVQTVTVNATSGTFTLTLNVPSLGSPGALTQTTSPIAYNASSEDLRTELDRILNPNGSVLDPLNPRNNTSKPYTNNVAVTKSGNVFMVSFQGEYGDRQIVSVNSSSVILSTRVNGLNYYGLSTLNLRLGSGNDVVNVQGTGAGTITNIYGNAGDEKFFVSSQSNYGLEPVVTIPPGNLDQILGVLNLDGGTGSHLLKVSDVDWGHEPQYLHNVRKIDLSLNVVSTIAGGNIRT
jgi:hypothetical protein